MAYIQPMVMVYQEYASTSTSTGTADLIPCIIGPCYQLVDSSEDSALAYVGTYYQEIQNAGTEDEVPAGFVDRLFPNLIAGAKIIPDSVELHLKNVRVQLRYSLAVSVTSCSANKLVLQSGNMPAGILVGDIIPLNGVEYLITKVDYITRTLYLNRTLPASIPGAIDILRVVDEIVYTKSSTGVLIDADNSCFTAVGLTAGTITTYNDKGNPLATFTDCPVMEAETYITYSALRTDLGRIGTIESVDQIVGAVGKISPENPLAFGLNVCLSNTTTAVRYIGVTSNNLAGYTSAKDRLESYDPVYAIVLLTQDTGILSMFKNHAIAMSAAEESRWRIVIGSCKMPEETTLAEGIGTVSALESNVIVFTGTGTPIESDKIAFMTDSVSPGDILRITTPSGINEDYTIDTVVSEDQLTITKDKPFASIYSDVRFAVLHKYTDRTDQANAVAAISKSFGDKRFVNVFPDLCTIDGHENLPSYYLACAVAGGVGGLPSHYGFTNLSMAGITGVTHSNDYFSKSQLNIIAGGGTFIFVQESPESVPYVRHQLTTDMSAIEFQELSFVKNFDYVSYICRDALKPFIGKWNITEQLLASVNTAVSAQLESLKLSSYPKIGSPVLGYSVSSVAQSTLSKDRVEMYVNVTFPYPLNTLGLHIISQ